MRYWETLINWDNRPRIDRFRTNRGWVLLAVRWFFFLIGILSPLIIWRLLFGFWERSKRWLQKRWFIEVYTLLWFVGDIAILLLINPSHQPNCLILFFLVLVLWRLVDVLQSGFSLSFLRDKPKIIPARSLILILFNYAEIIVIFSVVYFILQSHFVPSFNSILESLEYSFRVFVPFIETNDTFLPKDLHGNIVFYSEIVSSLFIHLFIVQRVLAYFRR